MKPVHTITGTMAPLDRANIDTDQIIPQTFLKRIERTGYGEFLFHSWARHPDGTLRDEFVLNRPEYRGAAVLVAGPNFGCGSSREHAAWAIQDWGFDAVITESAADIFRNNAHNIGMVVVELPHDDVTTLMTLAGDPDREVLIDLETQTVTAGDVEFRFAIEPTVKHRLRNGLDAIAVTMGAEAEIVAHETGRPGWMPTLGTAS